MAAWCAWKPTLSSPLLCPIGFFSGEDLQGHCPSHRLFAPHTTTLVLSLNTSEFSDTPGVISGTQGSTFGVGPGQSLVAEGRGRLQAGGTEWLSPLGGFRGSCFFFSFLPLMAR